MTDTGRTGGSATTAEEQKRAAAAGALDLVRSGMRLGLGTGSTVAHFLDLLAEAIASGRFTELIGVPTSERTADRAGSLGIPLASLHEAAPLDLTVDGADEVTPDLDLIKGLGGALLREKMVAEASDRLVVIADGSKTVDRLGRRAPLPVEVVRFGWRTHLPFVRGLGSAPTLRLDSRGEPYETDNGNYVVDCRFEDGMSEPQAVEGALRQRTGVVASGLFLGIATAAVIADGAGIRILRREDAG